MPVVTNTAHFHTGRGPFGMRGAPKQGEMDFTRFSSQNPKLTACGWSVLELLPDTTLLQECGIVPWFWQNSECTTVYLSPLSSHYG